MSKARWSSRMLWDIQVFGPTSDSTIPSSSGLRISASCRIGLEETGAGLVCEYRTERMNAIEATQC